MVVVVVVAEVVMMLDRALDGELGDLSVFLVVVQETEVGGVRNRTQSSNLA